MRRRGLKSFKVFSSNEFKVTDSSALLRDYLRGWVLPPVTFMVILKFAQRRTRGNHAITRPLGARRPRRDGIACAAGVRPAPRDRRSVVAWRTDRAHLATDGGSQRSFSGPAAPTRARH